MSKKKKANGKKKSTSKALVPAGSFEIANGVKFDPAVMGASEKIDNDDIQIPKIHLMQDMSDFVKDGLAQQGEFRDSSTGELIGDEEGFECFVIGKDKMWQVFETEKKKLKYKETIPFEGNEDLSFDEEDTGIHRDKVLRFYVVLLKELKEGMVFPYTVDFKRTSRQGGMDLSRFFFKMRQKGIPSYGQVFTISSKQKTSDEGFEFYVKNVNLGRSITKEELLDVQNWATTVKSAQAQQRIVVDDSDEKGETEIKGKTVNKKSKF